MIASSYSARLMLLIGDIGSNYYYFPIDRLLLFSMIVDAVESYYYSTDF